VKRTSATKVAGKRRDCAGEGKRGGEEEVGHN